MKKTRSNLLAAALCVAGLSTCILTAANAENVVSSSVLLEGTPDVGMFSPAGTPDAAIGIAFNGDNSKFDSVAPLPSKPFTPVQSFGPGSTVTQNATIPEPSTLALAGLGSLGLLVLRRRK